MKPDHAELRCEDGSMIVPLEFAKNSYMADVLEIKIISNGKRNAIIIVLVFKVIYMI